MVITTKFIPNIIDVSQPFILDGATASEVVDSLKEVTGNERTTGAIHTTFKNICSCGWVIETKARKADRGGKRRIVVEYSLHKSGRQKLREATQQFF